MIEWDIEKTLQEMWKVARCDESCHAPALPDGHHDWERRCPQCASGEWDLMCDTCWISSRLRANGEGVREQFEKAGQYAQETTERAAAAEAERDALRAEIERRRATHKAAIEEILRAGIRYGYDLGWVSRCPEVVITWDGNVPKIRMPNPTTDPKP